MFAKNYVIVEPVTNKEGSFLNTETDITDSQTQERSRPRKDLDTVGGFLDSCKDETPILLYFNTNDRIQRIPHILGDPPTVGQLRLNKYLRPLKIQRRVRYQIAGTSDTGWVIRVDERFKKKKYVKASKA